MSIERLAYLGFGVENPQAWLSFAVEGLGMTEGGASDGVYRLRIDERAWRIALHRSACNDVIYAGLEVAGSAELENVETALRKRDVAFRRLTPAEIASRDVGGGITLQDPDGLALEIVHDHASLAIPVRSNGCFVTGSGGLGHFVLTASDPERSTAFYRMLGFKHTDFISVPAGPDRLLTITFLHCNSRHHTVALAPLPLPRRLEHFMLEMSKVDEVIETYNRVRRLGLPIRRHLGRHPNDRMLSFYAVTPAGFDVEIGWDGAQIGADWEVKRYDRISLWGHEANL